MSALLRRVRRLEREHEPKTGRLIVIGSPYTLAEEAREAFLQREGIRVADADLVIWVLSFVTAPGPVMPRLIRNTPLA
ncbi:hypothetical protein D3218_01735 [Aureimonas flava]|uniref:Uncharacterized protein n=1 Tax=Aureimonas flava TaxID=2320271 RepID=A0A3A1WS28_9HYPH|nr:hypothetical protein [Aureimonas flava]RIY03505.1 hypothetical protein D3218_01735 [Aureimonas flava]